MNVEVKLEIRVFHKVIAFSLEKRRDIALYSYQRKTLDILTGFYSCCRSKGKRKEMKVRFLIK